MKITKVGYGAPAYTIRVTRLDYAGRKQHVEFDSYGVLRELMDDIEANPEVQSWLEESAERERTENAHGTDLGTIGVRSNPVEMP